MLLFGIFLFGGSLAVVDLGLSEPTALVLDACLSLVFFIQHSSMLRSSFRKRMARFVPLYYQTALYSIISGTILMVLVVFWQQSNHIVADVDGGFRWIPHAVYILGIGGITWTMLILKDDLAASDPLRAHLRGSSLKPKQFTVAGPYLWVRHPFYFSILLMIWSCPDLTADRLLFNIFWTVWIVIGTKLEERDLVADLGKPYQEYQRKVPMLMPYRIRRIS